MRKITIILSVLFILVSSSIYIYFSGKEYVIEIPEETIREKLSEKLPFTKTYLLIFDVTLTDPRVDLVEGSNRIHAGLNVVLNIRIKNQDRLLGGVVDASGVLKYAQIEGAFYLSDPVIEDLNIQGLPEKYLEKASIVVEKALTKYYSSRPVYTLKSPDIKQTAAKMVLKHIEINRESVVVTIGL